jgi:hypothetical protein
MSDPIKQLLAFMIAKELHLLCYCGSPATQQSQASFRPPMCDQCVKAHGAKWTDWEDLRQAEAFRKLLA